MKPEIVKVIKGNKTSIFILRLYENDTKDKLYNYLLYIFFRMQ